MESVTLRDMATDALRYWEPRRLVYNGILLLLVLGCAAAKSAGFAHLFSVDGFLLLFVLAVLANVAYCAAYIVDLFLQYSHFREQRRLWRLVIAVVGFTFAGVLTYFFSQGLFSGPV